jgi:hypothetical protein
MILMRRKKTTKAVHPAFPERSGDVLVTQRMLYAVRDELKHEIKAVDAKIDGLEARQNVKFAKLEEKIEKMSAESSRILALTEEQNARNIVVIDALTSLFHRQDRVEKRIDEVEKTMESVRR